MRHVASAYDIDIETKKSIVYGILRRPPAEKNANHRIKTNLSIIEIKSNNIIAEKAHLDLHLIRALQQTRTAQIDEVTRTAANKLGRSENDVTDSLERIKKIFTS